MLLEISTLQDHLVRAEGKVKDQTAEIELLKQQTAKNAFTVKFDDVVGLLSKPDKGNFEFKRTKHPEDGSRLLASDSASGIILIVDRDTDGTLKEANITFTGLTSDAQILSKRIGLFRNLIQVIGVEITFEQVLEFFKDLSLMRRNEISLVEDFKEVRATVSRTTVGELVTHNLQIRPAE